MINNSVNILYVTHNLESIISKTNRVLLLKEGKLINEGCPNEIINSEILSDLFQISIKIIKQDNYWRGIPSKD